MLFAVCWEACFCTTAAAQLNELPCLGKASHRAQEFVLPLREVGEIPWARVGLLLPC